MKKIILVLTHSEDDCAEMVIGHLNRMGADCVRLNTEKFHSGFSVDMSLGHDGTFAGHFTLPERLIAFDEVGAVWNRRVHDPEIPSGLENEPELREWMVQEAKWTFSMALTAMCCPVVNPWEVNERLKYNKLIQMRLAAELGFEIPDTVVTDESRSIRNFWVKAQGEVIMKKIRKGLIHMSDGRRVLFHTSRIPPEAQTEESVRRLRFSPCFLQSHLPKKYDIRSVVVGERVFSVAIHSQGVPEGVVDYRNAAMLGKLCQMPHEVIDLGAEANLRMVEFSRRFGLTFGSFDFVETPDGRLVFLEDNPNGQWAWLEHLTGAPIALAVAEHLNGLCGKPQSKDPRALTGEEGESDE